MKSKCQSGDDELVLNRVKNAHRVAIALAALCFCLVPLVALYGASKIIAPSWLIDKKGFDGGETLEIYEVRNARKQIDREIESWINKTTTFYLKKKTESAYTQKELYSRKKWSSAGSQFDMYNDEALKEIKPNFGESYRFKLVRSNQEMFLLGPLGTILTSTDSGDTWDKIDVPIDTNLDQVVSSSSGRIMASYTSKGILYYHGQGEAWIRVPFPNQAGNNRSPKRFSLLVSNNNKGEFFAHSALGLFQFDMNLDGYWKPITISSASGNNPDCNWPPRWREVTIVESSKKYFETAILTGPCGYLRVGKSGFSNLRDMYPKDQPKLNLSKARDYGNGKVTVSAGQGNNYNSLLFSVDSGESWTFVKVTDFEGQESAAYIDSYFHENGLISFIQADGTLLLYDTNKKKEIKAHIKIDDSGVAMTAPSFSPLGYGVVTGSHGTFLVSDRDKSSWLSVKTNTRAYLNEAKFFDNGAGVVSGGGGTIFRTPGDNADWDRVDLGITENLLEPFLLDDGRGVIAGAGGTMLLTDDYGKNWRLQTTDGRFPRLTAFQEDGSIFMVDILGGVWKSKGLLLSEKNEHNMAEFLAESQIPSLVERGELLNQMTSIRELYSEKETLIKSIQENKPIRIIERYGIRGVLVVLLTFILHFLVESYRYQRNLVSHYASLALAIEADMSLDTDKFFSR